MKLAHHNLVAWQRADDLFIEVHQLTLQQFPAYERYELGSQLRRAAYSVPANLVEGIAREHHRDQIRFFNIASSSLSELGYGLHACSRLGYIDEATYADLEQKVRHVAAPLRGLIRKARTQIALKLGTSVLLAVVVLCAVVR